MPNRYLGRDLANQRYLGRDVSSIRSFGRIIYTSDNALTFFRVGVAAADTLAVNALTAQTPSPGMSLNSDPSTPLVADDLLSTTTLWLGTGAANTFFNDRTPIGSFVLVWRDDQNFALFEVDSHFAGQFVDEVSIEATVAVGTAGTGPAMVYVFTDTVAFLASVVEINGVWQPRNVAVTRFSVANSMATTGVVAFQNSPVPGTGRYALADALAFSTGSILQPGEAFTGLVRVYVADANVDITAPLPSNVLIWSSANNWAILDVTAQASLSTAHYYTGSLNASVGLVRTDAQVYIGNASEWPAIDDGTLAGIHQEIFITGVNITTTTPTVAAGENYTTISNLEPVGANELAPFSYEYFFNAASLGINDRPNLTLASNIPGTLPVSLVVRDANGNTFTSNTLTFTIT